MRKMFSKTAEVVVSLGTNILSGSSMGAKRSGAKRSGAKRS